MSRAERRQALRSMNARQRLIPAKGRPVIDGPGLAILMPSRGTITIETAFALGAHLDGFPHLLTTVSREPVVDARNKLAKSAQDFPNSAPVISRNGWLALWIDSDAYWRAGTIRRMMQTLYSNPEIDMLAGWFGGRSSFSNPCAYHEDWTWPLPGKDCEPGDVIEIARSGFHFVLHRVELLDRLPENPFTVTEKTHDGSGEDLAFCDNVRRAGGRIWADTGALVAHVADDGLCYLPGEGAMRVVGGQLRKIESVFERKYDLTIAHHDTPQLATP